MSAERVQEEKLEREIQVWYWVLPRNILKYASYRRGNESVGAGSGVVLSSKYMY